jgi:hypothetical protein
MQKTARVGLEIKFGESKVDREMQLFVRTKNK